MLYCQYKIYLEPVALWLWGGGVDNLLEGVSYFILQIISVDNPM